MDSNNSDSERSLLLTKLKFMGERFDYELNVKDDLIAAKSIYQEIRKIKKELFEIQH